MEQVIIIGIQSVNFKDEKDGKTIVGTSFFYTQEKDNVQGLSAGKMFVSIEKSARLHYTPQVGDTVRVFYNRFGKPEDFELID